jgi:predicted RND superfamily exporter protein
MLRSFYRNLVLKSPIVVLIALGLGLAFLAEEARKLAIDASAETLLLEDDSDLEFTRQVNERYYSPDFLVITYSPKDGELLGEKTLSELKRLGTDLEKLDRVDSVTSLLNVPLLQSPPKPVQELLKEVPTLESEGIDFSLAREEFLNSPIYSRNLVSPDFKTTALLVNLKDDETYRTLLNQRNALRSKEKTAGLTPEEAAEYAQVQADFKAHRDMMRVVEHENIASVRAIMGGYREHADLFLGGVSMIADDTISFIKDDLAIFGTGVLIFLVITLWFIFRQVRWILLPVLICATSVVATTGLLGLFDWEVTVISSNFVSIQLIITMALTIHLIVKYRELARATPDAPLAELVENAVVAMAQPCFFAILTTIAGFSSLVFSGILPVMNFGWMMSAGVAVSLILAFLIFPAVLMLFPKAEQPPERAGRFSLTRVTANFTERFGNLILWCSAGILVVSIVGITQLRVENSFIDYFKHTTEIYQGMSVIDQQLGGTTPLDVIVRFESSQAEEPPAPADDAASSPEDEFFDQFEEEFAQEADSAQYWFTPERMRTVERVHDYLSGLPEVGKVISLGTLLKVGVTLNDNKPLDGFLLALVYQELPERFRKIILTPYVSVENDEVRISARVVDSLPELRRNELLKRIERELVEEVGLKEGQARLASLLVLYNNMLQSLFSSQILTLGFAVLVLMFMFLILFRSLKLAFIAIFPNLLSIGVVLGMMGWVGIPLDLMTITIAAISVGIAVDDTIHYIHRFKEEFEKDRNYPATMHRAHATIGSAMYYTSVTIVIGFSILVFSNFIPSIYFGLLTSLAMIAALTAALTLLPQLILWIKPFGKPAQA